jgi:hypothetical protein
MNELGRTLIILGVLFVAIGAVLVLSGRLPWIGHLPGDFEIRRGGLRIYLPLATCLLVSVVVSLVLAILRR